ncbi:MAG TPA: type I secretion protein [Cyanobacteria bacterium UBA11372]|nr:type I secretion protein [Cyanobacteria bacterium UBA11372]
MILLGADNLKGTGNELNNRITGNSGNNTLEGEAGNDILDGKAGNDTMQGGVGNDTYVVDSSADVVTENLNEGTDTVRSSIDYILGANLENLILLGADNLKGTGNELNNRITGNGGNNILEGKVGNDVLSGGLGNDTLVGGGGNDTNTGGGGADRFTFNSASEGIDRITDFAPVDDTIVVSAAGFGGGLVAGAAIAAEQFTIGTSATTANHRFIYNQMNGRLFFDQDGIGSSFAPVHIAALSSGLALTNSDIFVAV